MLQSMKCVSCLYYFTMDKPMRCMNYIHLKFFFFVFIHIIQRPVEKLMGGISIKLRSLDFLVILIALMELIFFPSLQLF